jgi:PilZ domain-containing protein
MQKKAATGGEATRCGKVNCGMLLKTKTCVNGSRFAPLLVTRLLPSPAWDKMFQGATLENQRTMFVFKRKAARAFVRLPAWITLGSSHSKEHVAFVRDISPRGIFFYSDFSLIDGQYVEFVVEYLKGQNRVRLHLNGHVVRVEQAKPTSATGIAVAFESAHDEVPHSRDQARR